MNCPRCNASVNMQMNRCSQCGQSILVYKKAVRISNSLYNEGLEKARVRNLSGAADTLERSLTYYKSNVNARNLLGLVYYEMGEIVAALTQWILSKNLCGENNEADYYIDSIQSNPHVLENWSLTIKKYNAALQSAKQGNEDLAIIQLKKVVSISPNFVRAQQLIALMYIIVGDEAKALNHLVKARKTDCGNTLTNRYINLLGGTNKNVESVVEKKASAPERKVFKGDNNVTVSRIGSYEKEKPRAFPFINVMIGVIIGLFVGIGLIMPTLSNKYNEDKASEVTDYGEKIAERDSKIKSLEYDKGNLENHIAELERQLKEANEDTSLSAAEVYQKILAAYKQYNDGDKAKALAAVADIDMSGIEDSTAKDIVDTIQSEDASNASAEAFEKGRTAYNSGKYDEAKEHFDEALELNKDNYDAIYFYGRLYHRQGNKEKAVEYYNRIIEDYPECSRAREAKTRLAELGVRGE
ncbi:MAG: tetratricopeptide repeat protein [Lachnospiraceae bacterium]|nr:tetratricopeptide repeat protein [Lachnospiraceae bacterium]